MIGGGRGTPGGREPQEEAAAGVQGRGDVSAQQWGRNKGRDWRALGGTWLSMEGKEKELSVDIKILMWATESMVQDLTKIENSRTGAGLQKDHRLGLDVWM